MDSFHAVKLFASENEMEFDAGDTDYNVVCSLDKNVESGEKVEDMSEENEETGSILQGETSKENTKKENLVEEGKNVEEDYDVKQENMKKVYRGN